MKNAEPTSWMERWWGKVVSAISEAAETLGL